VSELTIQVSILNIVENFLNKLNEESRVSTNIADCIINKKRRALSSDTLDQYLYDPTSPLLGGVELAERPELVSNGTGQKEKKKRFRHCHRSGRGGKKALIERAYRTAEKMGIALWCFDEAGPYATRPYETSDWQPVGHPARRSPTYIPNGTAKLLTLFHPLSVTVRVKGVATCPNTVLHCWLEEQLEEIVTALPPVPEPVDEALNRQQWENWRKRLKHRFTLPANLPPLRLLLVCDNLAGHKTPAFVLWLCAHGILPLYTPLGGSWLNMAESIQKILKHRALDGTYPTWVPQIIYWLEAAARVWNSDPTPFEWGGRRAARRKRERQHRLAGSGAYTRRPIKRTKTLLQKWR
jgi:hypothetical protein